MLQVQYLAKLYMAFEKRGIKDVQSYCVISEGATLKKMFLNK
jgi:hypothetical protein